MTETLTGTQRSAGMTYATMWFQNAFALMELKNAYIPGQLL